MAGLRKPTPRWASPVTIIVSRSKRRQPIYFSLPNAWARVSTALDDVAAGVFRSSTAYAHNAVDNNANNAGRKAATPGITEGWPPGAPKNEASAAKRVQK